LRYLACTGTELAQLVQGQGCGLVELGIMVRFSAREKVFLFSKMFEQALGPTQPPIRLITVAKWPGREADYLALSHA
jgi:hypothetical protein